MIGRVSRSSRSGEVNSVAVDVVGEPAPGTEAGTKFWFFSDFIGHNSSGELVFRAFLEGPNVNVGNQEGIWTTNVHGELSLLARRGTSLPGADGVFGFLGTGPKLINDDGQIAFKGSSSNGVGIWVVNTLGKIQPVVLTGSEIEIEPGDVRTVQEIANSLTPHQFNNVGQLAFWVSFADGSEGIFVATIQNGCDFNRDGLCNTDDLSSSDGLFSVGDIAKGVHAESGEVFDLNRDAMINNVDLVTWLDLAASEKGLANPLSPGDTNLDGSVDFADFLRLSKNFPGGIEWTDGNFDGSVDGTQFSDFLLLSKNYGVSAAVPESTSFPLSAVLVAIGLRWKERRLAATKVRGESSVAFWYSP